MKIVEAQHSDLESLFVYLDTQLSEIALEETPLFQPVSKSDCKMSEAHKARFSDGFKTFYNLTLRLAGEKFG